MSPEELLKEIRDEVKAIKKELRVVARLEERVGYHHETLGRFGANIDACTSDLSEIKIALAGNNTSTVDIQSILKWIGGLIAAFLIAIFLNSNHGLKAAVLPHDKYQKSLKIENKENK